LLIDEDGPVRVTRGHGLIVALHQGSSESNPKVRYSRTLQFVVANPKVRRSRTPRVHANLGFIELKTSADRLGTESPAPAECRRRTR
jgi:hypothetical protein